MKVALVYDRVNKWGGAERVLLALRQLYPDAPLYTSVYNPQNASWAKQFEIKTSFLQGIWGASTRNELLGTLMPIAFETFSFDEFDLVISITSEAAKGIITKPGTCHISYLLTPTRYLWSGYDVYFRNRIFRTLSYPFVSYLRNWDVVASKRPDYLFAISKEVQNRIKKYYKRQSEVIYPPVFSKEDKKNVAGKKYFLLVSRLSKATFYKRVDMVIEAFNQNKLPLKVVGTGSSLNFFKKRARSNIEFLGEVSDDALSELYEGAYSLIFPSNEDFGLVVVEAMSHGTPVIAFKGGGALETVTPGITGEFFDRQDSNSLNHLLKSFDWTRYNVKTIKTSAQRFSLQTFKKEFANLVNQKMSEYQKNL